MDVKVGHCKNLLELPGIFADRCCPPKDKLLSKAWLKLKGARALY